MRVAQWLNDRGVTAFVLKYRLHEMPANAGEIMKGMEEMAKRAAASGPPGGAAPPNIEMGAVENGAIADGQQAIKLVRSHAAEFGINPNKIGIIGFSAGGAVAGGATVRAAPSRSAELSPASSYSFTPGRDSEGRAAGVHGGGGGRSAVGSDARSVSTRWRASGAPAEIHIYDKGGHGFGTVHQGLPVDHWSSTLSTPWMGQQGSSHVPAYRSS